MPLATLIVTIFTFYHYYCCHDHKITVLIIIVTIIIITISVEIIILAVTVSQWINEAVERGFASRRNAVKCQGDKNLEVPPVTGERQRWLEAPQLPQLQLSDELVAQIVTSKRKIWSTLTVNIMTCSFP